VPVPQSNPESKKAESSPGSNPGSSSFSFFGRLKKRTPIVEAEKEAVDRGHFVEGAMDSTDGIPGGLK
jgi:hypothetical protein